MSSNGIYDFIIVQKVQQYERIEFEWFGYFWLFVGESYFFIYVVS